MYAISLSGTLEGTGTRWRASYRWQPADTVTPIAPYSVSAIEPYLNIHLRQPVSTHHEGLNVEALLDVNNLLAEGYRPYLVNGGTVVFAQDQRSVGAGVAFTFYELLKSDSPQTEFPSNWIQRTDRGSIRAMMACGCATFALHRNALDAAALRNVEQCAVCAPLEESRAAVLYFSRVSDDFLLIPRRATFPLPGVFRTLWTRSSTGRAFGS